MDWLRKICNKRNRPQSFTANSYTYQIENASFSFCFIKYYLNQAVFGRPKEWPWKDVHILISGTYDHVSLHGKGELRFQMELRLLINWPGDRESILDYAGGLNVISRVFINARGRQKREKWRNGSMRGTWPDLASFEDREMG